MNYRLFTSLLLMAVLTALYLWFCPPDDTAATKSTTTPGTTGRPGKCPGREG